MHDLIRRLSHWLGLLLAPGTGRRRAGVRAARTEEARTGGAARPAPVPPGTPRLARLPRHRSPYGLVPGLPLDGGATPLVRPYLMAYEDEQERARQRHRRLVLVLAADFGVDLDACVTGVRGVAA